MYLLCFHRYSGFYHGMVEKTLLDVIPYLPLNLNSSVTFGWITAVKVGKVCR